MTITSRNPSRRATATFSIARSMKAFCWYSCDWTTTSGGNRPERFFIILAIFSVTAGVSAPGCLLIVRTTACPPANWSSA